MAGESSATQGRGAGETPPSVIATATNDLSALQTRVQQLRRMKELRDEEEELEQELQDRGRTESRSRRRRKRHRNDSDSSDEPEIKVKNIARLTASSSFRHRDDWLADLQRAFDGATRRYRGDSRKILLAVDYMDVEMRAKWNRHVQAEETTPDWDAFKAWSLTALGIDQLAQVCKALDKAHQRSDQPPAAFQNYLESLEAHLPRDSEDLRAYKFYAKLSVELQDQIDRSSPLIPKVRAEVVILATRFWEANRRGRGERRGREERGALETPNDEELPASKRPRTDTVVQQEANSQSGKLDLGAKSATPTTNNNCFVCGQKGH
jgi:hypothetical protein